MVRAVGVMRERLPGLQNAGGRGRIGEHAVHQFQHRPRRAERHVELCLAPGLVRRTHPRGKHLVGAVEFLDVGALERVDRLLAVADGEHRAIRLARRFAGEELGAQRVRDAPLRRCGVLHLVQQQMIEPAIQLVQDPGGAGIDQKLRRPSDQVIVVEQARRLLVRRIRG